MYVVTFSTSAAFQPALSFTYVVTYVSTSFFPGLLVLTESHPWPGKVYVCKSGHLRLPGGVSLFLEWEIGFLVRACHPAGLASSQVIKGYEPTETDGGTCTAFPHKHGDSWTSHVQKHTFVCGEEGVRRLLASSSALVLDVGESALMACKEDLWAYSRM